MTTEIREALERWRRHQDYGKASPYWNDKEGFLQWDEMQDDAVTLADDYSRIVAELEKWRGEVRIEHFYALAAKITAILEGK